MKIVFTGPESSGKTTLAEAVCRKHPFTLVREFSREYLALSGTDYTRQDVREMGLLQLWEEKSIAGTGGHICCDTDLQNILVWQQVKYGEFDSDLLQLWLENRGIHYFVCKPDIPWEYDPLRENPHDRDKLFNDHVTILQNFDVPYDIVEGPLDSRLMYMEKHPVVLSLPSTT